MPQFFEGFSRRTLWSWPSALKGKVPRSFLARRIGIFKAQSFPFQADLFVLTSQGSKHVPHHLWGSWESGSGLVDELLGDSGDADDPK